MSPRLIADIHAQQGLNHDEEHALTIHTLINQGGAMTTDGINQFAADTVINKDVRDYEHGHSIGFSSNVNTLTNALTTPTEVKGQNVE